MTRRTRWLVIVGAIVCGLVTVISFLLTVGAGLSAAVSNCNRDCDDGTRAMYAGFVFGGLTLVLTIVAALARSAAPPPRIPEARIRQE